MSQGTTVMEQSYFRAGPAGVVARGGKAGPVGNRGAMPAP
jgi:hypothetical protein